MLIFKENLLKNMSNTKLEKVKGIVLHFSPDFYDTSAQWSGFAKLEKMNKETKDFGYHYGIDQHDLMQYVKDDIQAVNIKTKATYISTALYNSKPQESLISVAIFFDKTHDYELSEWMLIESLVELLKKHNLTKDDIWRAFDLSKDTMGPFHMLNKDIWRAFLTEVDNRMKDDNYIIVSPFKAIAAKEHKTIDLYIKELIEANIENPSKYASQFEPDHRDNKTVLEKAHTVQEGELKTRESPFKNTLQYKVIQTPPVGDHCVKAVDKMNAIQTTADTLVEPIYPDLVIPPGGEVHIADGFTETAVKSKSDTPLSAEELEKRQKSFNINDFKNVSKTTVGKPVNYTDPFPVDEQIKKVEEHYPKVKIDKIKFDFDDDNHPGSTIGAATAKHLAMIYDIFDETSKRTEQRLTKIENNLATVMRNLFRMGSRVNINCVYYGGQSVYGKYRCIRCLHDNRINDGETVTLDQCLNCTRYEPIEGQVYAILDDTGSNIVQVMDDLQMAYMDVDDYKELSRVEEFHKEPKYAKVTKNPTEPPKLFSEDKWKEKDEKDKTKDNKQQGFKMDWKPTKLETHTPHINKYDTEGMKADKKPITSDNQNIDDMTYEDTRGMALEYEVLEFDTKNYEFADFGKSSDALGGNIGVFGSGGSEVRKKIVDYAKAAVALCQQGKAGYSQDTRDAHGNKNINGIQYWDCSSLARDAYASAGISGIGGNTYEQYPNCIPKVGGICIPIFDSSKALPGDLMFFTKSEHPTKDDSFNAFNSSGVHHVGIYIGNNEYAHASTSRPPLNKQIKISPLGWDKSAFCFARPKALVELDKVSGNGVGEGYWSKEQQKIPDDMWKIANANTPGQISQVIANMQKYNYKDLLINISKELGMDPYFTAAIATVESAGDPTDEGDHYAGLLQVEGWRGTTDRDGIADNIRKGLEMINRKKAMLKQYGWTEKHPLVLAYAFNSGEGTTCYAAKGAKINLGDCPIGPLGDTIFSYVKSHQSGWDPVEKRTYAAKVLVAYNLLKQKNVLG